VPDSRSASDHTLAAALAYPLGFVTGLICLWRFPDDPYVRFHAWQSILLSIAVLAAIAALDFVPLLGLGLVFLLSVGATVLTLFLMWRAYQGHWVTLPLLGDIAIERARSAAR
jgi:uncharacterized membrane protein